MLDALPGEEAQVDYGQGALTRLPNGKYRRPYLFVMTLKYSGKSFRKVVWKADQEIWARLHEEAFRAFGGSVAYVVLDNLKQGVIEPDLYEPALNPVYAAMLAHYGAVADAARVVDPNRKGTVENAIQHTQSTALKGRKFDSIEAQNAWLAHWEERWAAPRIHGRKKRQVLAMFAEEKPALKAAAGDALPLLPRRPRTPSMTAGWCRSCAPTTRPLPALAGRHRHGAHLRARHRDPGRRRPDAAPPSAFHANLGTSRCQDSDRIFNPSRETARFLGRVGQARTAQRTARPRHLRCAWAGPGRRRSTACRNLPRHYASEDIESACERRAHLEPALLSRPQTHPGAQRRRDRAPLPPCPSCSKPARTSATSRNTKPSSKTHNTTRRSDDQYPENIGERCMTMSITELERSLRALRLSGMTATLENRALQVAQQQMDFIEAFSCPRARRTRSAPLSSARAALHALRADRAQGPEGLRLEL